LGRRLRKLETQETSRHSKAPVLTSDETRRRLAELIAIGASRAKAWIEAGNPPRAIDPSEDKRRARINELLAIAAARVAAAKTADFQPEDDGR
jgi:hypothetical protein